MSVFEFLRRERMENYIFANNKKIVLTDEQADIIVAALREMSKTGKRGVILAEVPAGEVVKIGGQEMIVLEHVGDQTYLITKNFIEERTAFSEKNNNYEGSLVDKICETAAELLEDLAGKDNVVEFDLELTSDDGLKDYGQIHRKVALLTADMYRKYVDILDKHKPGKYWWLATPHSTKRHENDAWVKCVSPSGYINRDIYYGDNGVRPFCILKSNIFVSR